MNLNSDNINLAKQHGFSILELTITLAIIGIMLTGALVVATDIVKKHQEEETETHLEEIMTAIDTYRKREGHLPCVTSRTDTQGDATFGKETNAGDCTYTVAPGGTERIETAASSGVWMVLGAVPTRSLGLRDEFMKDAYGNHIIYAVMQDFTETATYATGTGAIVIKDGDGNDIMTDGAYVVISHGKDEAGAYRVISGTVKVACGATNLDTENCDSDITFVAAPYNEGDVAANYFDDEIRWRNIDYYTAIDALEAAAEAAAEDDEDAGAGGGGGDVDLLNGLISYWKLDEAGGTDAAVDAHGIRNLTHLTNQNNMSVSTGMFNNARSWGASSYFSGGENAELSTGNVNFTIAFWMYCSRWLPNTSYDRGIVSKGWNSPATANNEFSVWYDATTRSFAFSVYGGGTTTTVKSNTVFANPVVDTWYHVVAWHDADNDEIGITVNASPEATAAHNAGVNDGTQGFLVGRNQTTTSDNYYLGSLDEIGFWKRVLTEDERKALFNYGSGLSYDDF